MTGGRPPADRDDVGTRTFEFLLRVTDGIAGFPRLPQPDDPPRFPGTVEPADCPYCGGSGHYPTAG